jgi:hypothetical protein
MLASVGGELPEGLLQAMVEELGIEDTASMLAAMEQPAGAEEPPADTLTPPTTEEYMATADKSFQKKTELTDAAKAQISKAEKAATDAAAQVAELRKSAEAADAKRVELEKQIATERDERLTREFVAKAAKLDHLPAKTDELGAILKALHAASPDATAKLEKLLEGTNEKLAKVIELTKEVGRGGEPQATTAWAAIEKAAVELRKTDGKLTKEQAITKAMEQNPALYEQHNRESATR